MSNNNDNMQGEITITFMVSAGNPFDLRAKKETLQKFARLPMEDQERIEQIISSQKALKALKDKWLFLKAMFK